ncbi:Ig-like domain-containing protein, partial [Acinetobacter sp. YH12094]
ATVTGKTEPGATVVIKDPAGNPVPVTVNPDGTFTATVPAPAPEGAYTVEATDLAGNTGTGTATLEDNVPPAAPTDLDFNDQIWTLTILVQKLVVRVNQALL